MKNDVATLTDDERLRFDLFASDRDNDGVRVRTSNIVTTRKPHTCRFSEPHEIPIGSRARFEKALVDGVWGSFYVCCACLDDWITKHDG